MVLCEKHNFGVGNPLPCPRPPTKPLLIKDTHFANNLHTLKPEPMSTITLGNYSSNNRPFHLITVTDRNEALKSYIRIEATWHQRWYASSSRILDWVEHMSYYNTDLFNEGDIIDFVPLKRDSLPTSVTFAAALRRVVVTRIP